MNIIGIDISIDSTGMSIYRGDELLLFNFTILKNNVGWIKKTMPYVDYEFINYTYKDIENYTESELMKLREYDLVTDKIFNKILGNIDKNEETYIAMEGYNYGLKNTNSIVDIVTFSTLLRIKLLNIPKLEKIIFISPKSLKSEVASMVYGFTVNKNGKKTINKNLKGVSGGNFDKKDMLVAIMDMKGNDKLSNLLDKYKDELLKLKNIPKPWDDICDSWWILQTLTV
jgi:hypothetical protein